MSSGCSRRSPTAAPTGRCHDVTGPEALDLTAIAGQTGQATGRTTGKKVRYVDLEPPEYVRETAAEDLDPWWAYAFRSMFASVREQRWSTTADEVAVLTGRAATPLADLLTRRFGSA